MTTVQVLRKARALIVKGWCQGHMREYKNGKATKRCAFGAILETPRTATERQGAINALDGVLPKDQSIVTWNDSPYRRKAQVLAAFDRAIKACK